MLKNILPIAALSLTATLLMSSATAQETSVAVNKSSCGKLAHTTQPFILVLNSGDELIASITQCAKEAKLMGASVSGLGQAHNPTLAYFSSNPDDKPSLTTFSGYYELASLNGNITNNANHYYTHIHAVLADQKFRGIAGHVNTTKIGLTAEITIIPFSASVLRTVDPKTGFGPIVH